MSAVPGSRTRNCAPLFTMLRDTVPAPSYDPAEPLRAHVTNLDAWAGSRCARWSRV
jgi:hypothetical protein